MTMASLPPLAPGASSRGAPSLVVGAGSSVPSSDANPTASATAATLDPESLLDTLDSFTDNSRYAVANNSRPAAAALEKDVANSIAKQQQHQQQQHQQQQHNFDPIEFLNQHYHTEQQLITALPSLRSAISSRLTNLDDNLSTTLRHQAALAPTLAKDVIHARHAVLQLATRIQQVRDQAQKSEVAVLEITRDMKRLDYAKRHLQRTITALKRLHMLLHAAEQLRMAALVSNQQPIPRYEAAAHLVDATRLLLGHFEGYMSSVPKMRQVRDAVGVIKGQLWEGIVKLFHEVGVVAAAAVSSADESAHSDESAASSSDQQAMVNMPVPSPSSMVQKTLSDACLVVEALGPKSKERFISDFIKDHLQEYEQLYNPSPAAMMAKQRVAKKSNSGGVGAGAGPGSGAGGNKSPGPSPGKSFKKSASALDANSNTSYNNSKIHPTSLETVENRFAWYRSKLRSLQHQFAHVFPPQWNVHYRLTTQFLEITARHLKFVLKKKYNKNVVRIPPFNSGGGGSSLSASSGAGGGGGNAGAGVSMASAASKFGSLSVSTHGSKSTHGTSSGGADGNVDSVSEGEKAVTALLKALQKTILFEKEMTAWLTRDFGTKFMDPSMTAQLVGGGGGENSKEAELGDINNGVNDLEFDEHGRAVAAKSAEGIKIKYERRKRMGGVDGNRSNATTANIVDGGGGGPVPQLAGIASTTFDDHMSPYVALEERSMDEQLYAATSDSTVDTRGERPAFVSSTNLFIYMKNSITRCTALTKEKTFFLLQRAFQKKLRSYAQVLEKKLPPPLGTHNVAKMALANISQGGSVVGQATNSTIYRIPPNEEVTICHVIDTCEYCADTVEALEDLIQDKIGDKYKEKIDMSEEQGAFQDVTAKSIRVLVSGLEQRLDVPLKEISRTNWSSFDMVGEESTYVRTIHLTVHPFVVQVRELIPSSYFRSFCDKFALTFASTYYRTLLGLKRISEAGTQQLLLDVYSIKTLLLKLPVLEAEKKTGTGGSSARHHANTANLSGGSTIAPAMYTKMVNKEFRKLEVMLKLVGSPKEMLVDMFRAQWDCSMDTLAMASDFTTIMMLKGIPRTEHAAMLETLGVDAGEGGVGTDSSTMTANMQALQERGSDVAAKVNADLNQMRQRVDDFRKAFR
ncbi:hypothetical protein ACHAXR_011910 [Thalassiosira sp. AJA248-18]